MEALSVRDYRNNLAASFDRADGGEEVLIRRNNRLYALVSVGCEDIAVTPELRRRIDDARRAYASGQSTVCDSTEQLSDFLDSL